MGVDCRAAPSVLAPETAGPSAASDARVAQCCGRPCSIRRKRSRTVRSSWRGLYPQPWKLLLVAALRVSCADDGTQQPAPVPTYSLTEYQHSNLAQLVQYTMQIGAGHDSGQMFVVEGASPSEAEQEERCLYDLAQMVDRIFTHYTPAEVRQKMWDSDLGISQTEADKILTQVQERIGQISPRNSCKGYVLSQQQEAANRMAYVLTRALQKGRSLNFQMHETLPDVMLAWFGNYRTIGFSVLLMLAITGALLTAERYIFRKVFGPREVPCQCLLCLGDIVLQEQIGEGGFGEVFKCRSGNELLVTKMIPVDLEKNVNVLQDALDEAKLLIELRHPNIVEYKDVFIHRDMVVRGDSGNGKKRVKTRDSVCIVMEYCRGGTLLDHVTQGVHLPLDAILSSLLNIFKALAFIHSRGLIHFDVKLENIFITVDPAQRGQQEPQQQQQQQQPKISIKLGDFGLAMRSSSRGKALDSDSGEDRSPRESGAGLVSAVVGGTAPYQAPECFLAAGVEELTNKVDVWSVGCLMYEAVTCQSLPTEEPYLGMITQDEEEWAEYRANLKATFEESLVSMLTAANISISRPKPADQRYITAMHRLQTLLDQMLSVDPAARPAFEELQNDPAFQGFEDTPRWFSSAFVDADGKVVHPAETNKHKRAKSLLPFPQLNLRRREVHTDKGPAL